MAEPGSPTERRTPAAYQPIEVIDETEAVSPAQPTGYSSEPSYAPEGMADPGRPALAVPIAVRFESAASALVFAGQLLAAGRAGELAFCSGVECARWVRTRTDLDMARELAAVARGDVFMTTGTGHLVEDLGWGDSQTTTGRIDAAARSIDPAGLVPVSLAELVRIAGLHPVREQPMAEARILLQGYLLPKVLGRALDLRLDLTHRPVRLHPLFLSTASAADPATVALIELRLRARRGTIPPSLLTALTREPLLNVCRVAGDTESLLMEYGMASPLLDHLLATMIKDQAWVLSNGRLGCHIIEPGGVFADSTGCVRLSDSQALESPVTVPSDDRPAPAEFQVIRERTPGQAVDAVLLANSDLDAIVLLLEGHPLSDSAQLVRGRDRHLLIAPGGVLEQLPVGESLYCLGPGLLYLPLGFGTRPRLPPSARRALFAASDGTAVVVLPTAVLQFSLDHREPVWTLWVGAPPEIDVQLPEATTAALGEIAASDSGRADADDVPDSSSTDGNPTNRTWLDDALDAELRGALAFAGELHERHGDPIRAARLFARAAQENGDSDGVITQGP